MHSGVKILGHVSHVFSVVIAAFRILCHPVRIYGLDPFSEVEPKLGNSPNVYLELVLRLSRTESSVCSSAQVPKWARIRLVGLLLQSKGE